ncbi:MAG: GNAT family N-acetyltransferase, partial [Halanaerobiaceae bacterium]
KKVENQKELKEAMNIRYRVFVEEQGVPENLERDEKDGQAVHVVAQIKNDIIGCGRIVFSTQKGKIGRVAVLKSYRGQGIGSDICKKLIKIAEEKGVNKVILHAQLHSVEFYKKLGFEPVGDIFEEAGIDHIKMVFEI